MNSWKPLAWLVAGSAVLAHQRQAQVRLRTANKCVMMVAVDTSTDRFVLVPHRELDDLLELSRLAAERLPDTDPLASALRGSRAQVRSIAVLEPGK